MSVLNKAFSLLLVAVALLGLSPLQAQPKVTLGETTKEVGEIVRGEKTTVDFVLQNEGDQDLVVLQAHSTCVCLTYEYPDRIPAGESGTLKLTLDTLPLQGDSFQTLTVTTNEPDNPQHSFVVSAKVVNVVAASPGFARYKVVQGFDEKALIKQVLWAPDGADFRIVRVESSSPFLSVSHRESTAEEKTAGTGDGPFYTVETVLAPDAPVGPLSGFVVIHLDHPEQKVVPIPVAGFVRPVFAITPPEGKLGELNLEEAKSQAFHVKNFATEEIDLVSASCNVEGIEAEIQTEQEGRVFYVVLTLTPEMSKGPFSGQVTIETSSPRSGTLTLPISGTVL